MIHQDNCEDNEPDSYEHHEYSLLARILKNRGNFRGSRQ
jgi:hypothetical protein